MDLLDLAVDKIKMAIPDAPQEVVDFRGERTIVVPRERIVEVCRLLRQDEDVNFNFLSDVTATDYWPDEPRFAVLYHLYSMPNSARIRLKVQLSGDDAHLPTITPVYPSANWYEREVWDLFGIVFDGHPDLRRILLPNDWEGHPLRRDYPLGYEDVQFSFNWQEIEARKPHPKE